MGRDAVVFSAPDRYLIDQVSILQPTASLHAAREWDWRPCIDLRIYCPRRFLFDHFSAQSGKRDVFVPVTKITKIFFPITAGILASLRVTLISVLASLTALRVRGPYTLLSSGYLNDFLKNGKGPPVVVAPVVLLPTVPTTVMSTQQMQGVLVRHDLCRFNIFLRCVWRSGSCQR